MSVFSKKKAFILAKNTSGEQDILWNIGGAGNLFGCEYPHFVEDLFFDTANKLIDKYAEVWVPESIAWTCYATQEGYEKDMRLVDSLDGRGDKIVSYLGKPFTGQVVKRGKIYRFKNGRFHDDVHPAFVDMTRGHISYSHDGRRVDVLGHAGFYDLYNQIKVHYDNGKWSAKRKIKISPSTLRKLKQLFKDANPIGEVKMNSPREVVIREVQKTEAPQGPTYVAVFDMNEGLWYITDTSTLAHNRLFQITAEQAYGDVVDEHFAKNQSTYREYFRSSDYGRRLLDRFLEIGPEALQEEMFGKKEEEARPNPLPLLASLAALAGAAMMRFNKTKSRKKKITEVKEKIIHQETKAA